MRTLPQSLDAEKGVLSSCLLSPQNVLGDASEKLSDQSFYDPKNQIIFREALILQNSGNPLDFITLTQHLQDKGELDKAGGAAYISELYTFVPTASNADYYIEIVRERFLLRQLIQTCTDFASRAYEEQGEVKGLLDEAEAKIMLIGEERFKGEIITSRECALSASDRYTEAKKRGGVIAGLTTGLGRLDSVLRGIRPTQMVVIAAKQKHGKSALGWQIADFNALKPEPIAVGGISLEMSEQDVTDRRVAMCAKIDISTLADGTYTTMETAKISSAIMKIGRTKVFIKDEAGVNILQIRTTLRRMVQQHKIELAIIDYLQIIQAINRRDGRERQVAEISQNIKMAAKELNIPIIVLVQLNKDGDARESSAIEMDCDKFIVIENDPDQDEDSWEQDPEPKMWLRVKYNRAGPCGRVPVRFIKKYTYFEGL